MICLELLKENFPLTKILLPYRDENKIVDKLN